MTELYIYKFINENDLECKWQDFYEKGKTIKKLNLWIPSYLLKEFCYMLGDIAFDDGGICETMLCPSGYTFIKNLDEILDYYGIDAENIISKNNENN